MRSRQLFIHSLLSLFALVLAGGFAQAASITIEVLETFDYPGTGNLTRPQKINDHTDIVGIFVDSSVIPIVIPDATGFSGAYQLNASNQFVGYYTDSGAINHGFYLDNGGTLRFPVDPDGSTGTILFGLNNRAWVVGRFSDSAGATHG